MKVFAINAKIIVKNVCHQLNAFNAILVNICYQMVAVRDSQVIVLMWNKMDNAENASMDIIFD